MINGIQIVVDRNVPPSPGDGIVFATVAYRTIDDTAADGIGPWHRWRGFFVKHSNDPAIQVLFVDDVVYEAHNWGGVPGAYGVDLDPPGLDRAVQDGPNDAAPDPALVAPILVAESDLVKPVMPEGWHQAMEDRVAAVERRLNDLEGDGA
jgi:hypothetical protein